MRGQAPPCTEGATGSSRRSFPKKKKTLWGTLGNSPAATAPVPSPPHHSSLRDCAHLISEGAETTGTTRGRVPSNWECAYPLGSARTSSLRELRLQEPPGGGCSANGSVCTSSRRELRPQEPGRVQIKEGSSLTPIAQRRPTIKKEWVEAGNTRIPPGRGNPPTKEPTNR